MIKKVTGSILMRLGIKKAVDHANVEVKGWSDHAYNFLLTYSKTHKEFMVEDVREASKGIVPVPPSGRAWGGVVVRASKAGVIRRKGFQNVKNAKAHCTPATLWEVI
jgi:hypothetical protein